MLYDIVVYIFSSFWRWFGAMVMITVIGASLNGMININKITTYHNRGDSDAQRPDNRSS